MQAMATRIRLEPAGTLLNRGNPPVSSSTPGFELATDESLPLLERVNYCSIFSSNLDEFFQGTRCGPPGTGGIGRRHALCGRADTPAGARAHPGASTRADCTPVATLEARAAACECGRGHHRRRYRRPRPEGARTARAPLPTRDLPRAHATRGRTGQPFPYISGLSLSLAIFAEDTPTRPRSVSPGSRFRRVFPLLRR